MKHSPRDPVFTVREPAPLSEGGPDESSAAAASAAAAARELISIRGLDDTEHLALEMMCKAALAGWAALYRPAEAAYKRGCCVGIDPDTLPPSLDSDVVEKLLRTEETVGLCGEADLGHEITTVTAYAHLKGEFDHQPMLLLIGSTDAEVSPVPPNLVALDSVSEVCAIALRNAELVERLQSEVFIDFVTHCYNRRAFEEHLKVELVRARRYERPLCLLLLDLDDFKNINDELGHPVGDHALQRVGETLKATFRTTDRVCRYGGDEFAVIFPETSKEDVMRLAERLRRQISKIFPDSVVPTPMTSSIGVAGYPHDAARADELVKAADRALYRAKEAGRNQVVPA